MSLKFTDARNIADDPSDVLVNTINAVGVMGKGVALDMKTRFPEILPSYIAACNAQPKRIAPGSIHISRTNDGRRIVGLVTKDHWSDNSRLEWAGSSLLYLNMWLMRQPQLPASIALPMPGAGNGGLDPARIQNMVRTFLAPAIKVGVEVTLYAQEKPLLRDEIYFAGVGSRKTPRGVLSLMSEVGSLAAERGWILRSGGAIGADSAFHNGVTDAAGRSEIFLPKYKDTMPEGIVDIRDVHFRTVKNFHGAIHLLNDYAVKLMARNACQVFGVDFAIPSSVLVCWTIGGNGGGGTGQAIRMANAAGIPVIDLGKPELKGISGMDLIDLMQDRIAVFHEDRGLIVPEPSPKSALEMIGL